MSRSGFLLELDDNGVLEQFYLRVHQLGEKRATRLFRLAMNKKGRQGTTAVKRAIRKQTSIKYGDISKVVKFRPARGYNLETRITGTSREMPLSYFKPRKFSYGVGVTVWGKRQRYSGQFIVAKYGGGVFVRASKARFPIRQTFGPSVAKEMVKDESRQAFEDNASKIMLEVNRLVVAGIA